MAFRSIPVLLLALVMVTCITAFTENAVDCCLSTSKKLIPFKIVKSYHRQTADSGCPITAIQFITVKDKQLCAPFPSGHDWVAKLMKRLDERMEQ